MPLLLDTSIAILLRDMDPAIASRVAALDALPILSVLSVVELEGGIAASAIGRDQRRRAVNELVEQLTILPFGPREARICGRIVQETGFSRPKIIDRMIAAQALSVGASLATLNPRDFRGISGLTLEDWTR